MPVLAMAAVHEKVEKRASQNEKPRQDAEQVRAVFGIKKESGDTQEHHEPKAGR